MAKQVVLTTARRKLYELDARTINFYRRNPVIACEDLLGIYLSDIQAYILSNCWTAEKSAIAASRNFGKSFIICIICILRAILYPDQNIYIVSSVGNQAKNTFSKLEEIITRTGKTASSIPDLKDISQGEVVTTGKNQTGFNHNPASYSVEFYNGSKIFTLNSSADNIRGFRSSLTVFDEAAYCSEELILAVEPFSTQDSDAKYGKNAALEMEMATKQPPNQIIYVSSQESVNSIFYQRYKEFARKMIAGDRNYFVSDCPCDLAITMHHKGQPIPALLKRSVVDDALRSNADQARREYFNKADQSGGESQIIKWGTMRNNEKQIIPYSDCRGNKIILALDPARTIDNSIMSAMEIVDDPDLGICGNIIGCTNFVDLASSKKYKLDSNRQLDEIRNIILGYNGDHPDYEFIDSILIDQGSGGGGVSAYADGLLNNFIGHDGKKHRGFIDATHEIYSGYRSRYPDAVDKLRLISPRKYRTQMVEEFIELMELGVIRFPYQYNGQEFLKLIKGIDEETDEEIIETYNLSKDEIVHLNHIDLMKTEICSIHKTVNAEKTSVNYALAKEKQNKMHDDRFFTCLLLAHRLYELRRGKIIRDNRRKRDSSQFVQFRAPKIL